MRKHRPRPVALWFVSALISVSALGQERDYDPVVEDPPVVDYEHPATTLETGFDVHGSRVNATFFLAQGEGPHPSVVLLHGFPGYEKQFDLAHAMRRAGWNVLIFHYRGAWGSEGSFSLPTGLEDVAAAITWVRAQGKENARIDPDNVVVVGHSVGGFFTLITAASDPSVRCAASLAGVNFGRIGKSFRENPGAGTGLADAFDRQSGPLSGFSGAAMVNDLIAHAEPYDFLDRIDDLKEHTLLLVAGTRDTVVPIDDNHAPLARALDQAGAQNVTSVILDADHGFSDKRIALSRALVSWLEQNCR